MADTAPSAKLTFEGAQKLLAAAIAKAKEINQPQCICIVDSGGHLLTMARMDGAFALSVETALRKAGLDIKLAIATEGKRVNLLGGLPVIVDGHVAGAIGVGSGTGEQDREVAAAALGAIAGAKRFAF